MYKVINGKKYNTDTAKKLGRWTNGKYGDFDYFAETLCVDKSGKYFIHGEGGARTHYASQHGGIFTEGEAIVPIGETVAREWAEEHLTCEEYEAAFGLVDEYGREVNTIITAHIPLTLRKELDAYCSKTGAPISDVVARGIMAIIK